MEEQGRQISQTEKDNSQSFTHVESVVNNSKFNNAVTLGTQDKFDLSEKLCASFFACQEETEKNESQSLMQDGMNNLFNRAFSLSTEGEYDRALQVYEEMYDSQKDILFPVNGSGNMQIAQVLRKLSCIFYEKKDYEKAKELCEKVLPVFINYYGSNHTEVNTLIIDLNMIYNCWRLNLITRVHSLSLNYTSLQSVTKDVKVEAAWKSLCDFLVSRLDSDVFSLAGEYWYLGKSGWQILLCDRAKADELVHVYAGAVTAKNYGKVLFSGSEDKTPQEVRDKVGAIRYSLYNDLFVMVRKDRNIEAWYYVLVYRAKRKDMFLEKYRTGSIADIKNYGYILHHGWGQDPPVAISHKLETVLFSNKNGEQTITNCDTSDFHDAARAGEVETLEYLFSQKGYYYYYYDYVNSVDENGWTSLHHAAYGGNLKAVKYLIDNGADVHAKDTICGRKPAHIAAREDHASIVNLFLSRAVTVNDADNNGWTLLHYATWSGSLVTLEFLINQKADINARDVYGIKPIHIAAEKGFTNVLKCFIRRFTNFEDTDKDGCTPLYYAASNGHLETVKFLSDKGASVKTSRDSFGIKEEPLGAIHASGSREITEFLIRKGVSVDTILNYISRITPLCWAAANGKLEIMAFLIAEGADVNFRAGRGLRPLHFAASKCQLEAMELLIANGADVNAKDAEGKTPLDRFEEEEQKNKMDLWTYEFSAASDSYCILM